MLDRSFLLSLRGANLVFAVCVVLSVTLLVLPFHSRIVVADRLGVVLTAPYWRARNHVDDLMDVRDENTRLRVELAENELLTEAGMRMQRDTDRLAGPALEPGYEGELVPCRVVVRQRNRFASLIKVEALVPADWRPWQPVITQDGYIGRLRTVINDREAWVELLTAQDFALGVEIDRTGLLGVLRPRGDRLVMEMVGRDEDVLPGDRVITSGIAEIRQNDRSTGDLSVTPRGFPVGEVAVSTSPSDKIFKEILVRPAASFEYNETVFVVTTLKDSRPGRQDP